MKRKYFEIGSIDGDIYDYYVGSETDTEESVYEEYINSNYCPNAENIQVIEIEEKDMEW